jgi:hypothetical protein
MNRTDQLHEPVYSAYGHDPELSEVVSVFATDLADRVANLRGYLDRDDLVTLAQATRQLRATAGRYGFDQVVPCMQNLESSAQQRAVRQELERAFQEVVEICNRVRPGGPE